MSPYVRIAAKMLRAGYVCKNGAYPWTLSEPSANMGETTMPVRLREMARGGLCRRWRDADGRVQFSLTNKGVRLAKNA